MSFNSADSSNPIHTNRDDDRSAEIEYLTGRPQSRPAAPPSRRPDFSHKKIPDTPYAVSVISFLLGGICAFSLSVVCRKLDGLLNPGEAIYTGAWWATPQLGFFFAAWSFFHWAEYAVTAGWNREKCGVDSFLLDNGALYHIAHGTAVTEYLARLYFRPDWKAIPYISSIGIVLVVLGQLLRSTAMIHAASNFSHAVAFEKASGHKLVVDGIYAWFRHPSYAGFFYWALGTQCVLQNPVSFILYSILLWRFFFYRTRSEEAALIRFFGEEYIQYRKRVGTKIPFVP